MAEKMKGMWLKQSNKTNQLLFKLKSFSELNIKNYRVGSRNVLRRQQTDQRTENIQEHTWDFTKGKYFASRVECNKHSPKCWRLKINSSANELGENFYETSYM